MKSLKVLFMVAFIALFLVLVALSPPATQTTEQNSNEIAINNITIAVITTDPANTGQSPGLGNVYAIAADLFDARNAQAAMSHSTINNPGTKAMEFKKAGGTDITVLRKYLPAASALIVA